MDNKNKIETEINFKNLIKNPIRLFGWIFPLVLVLIVIGGIYYVKNIDNIYRNELSPLISDSTFIIPTYDLVQKKGGIIPAVNLNLISNPTPEFINKGKELFAANCMSCHGQTGMGDGSASAALNPKPRNIHQLEGWTNGRKFSEIYKTLQEGIVKNGMAAYEYLPSADRIAIISYIRTFVEFPAVTQEEISQIDDTYKLSAGTLVPNQIPIVKSIDLLINENSNNSVINNKNEDVLLNQLITKYVVNSNNAKKLIDIPDSLWSQQNFIDVLSVNPFQFGFKSSLTALNNSEWLILYNYFNKLRLNKEKHV
ncbi:MAG: cytochrome c [bacterium]